ncbi:MAG TPA: HEAT repeat domain-containing protein [Ktedonobacteraceae bacterium]|nr:HEAT repeat domain-containing protein [Ktedonobacteraceae bacterium]
MSTTTYTPPVNKLLTIGEPESVNPDKWPDYRELGLGPEHIPELIRMAIDPEFRGPEAAEESEEEDPDFWAPLHAIRALGQLHAETAIEPLVNLLGELNDDEWMFEELPLVFGMLGPAAIPALAAYLADTSHEMYSRSYASNGITEIADRYPESREECIAIISKQLENFEENDEELNAFLVTNLLHIKAVETLPLIERAFKADKVDDFIVDLDDVLVGFGLKEREIVDNPFLNFFKNMSTSSAKQNETSSTTPEESYLLPLPPARTPSHSSDKIIKFSGKRIIKKKGKKKR